MYERWSPASTCPREIDAPKPRFDQPETRDDFLGPQLPGPDPHVASLLERARLRARPAVRHGNGRGDLSSIDRLARPGPEPVEGGLCAAVAPTDRRPLRREPQPPRALLPVPGGAEAEPTGPPAALYRQPCRDRHRSVEARHPLRRGRLGKPDARRVGTWLGSLVRRDGSHPVHVFPAGRR